MYLISHKKQCFLTNFVTLYSLNNKRGPHRHLKGYNLVLFLFCIRKNKNKQKRAKKSP